MKKIIVVAGATGNLGLRIVKALSKQDVEIRALVRVGSNPEKTNQLKALGATIYTVDMTHVEDMTHVCKNASCVVSVLAGLDDTILEIQKKLLDAALAAGVPRFIPSDYSLDFTKFSPGENRNLDWRREFHTYLDRKPIAATSIFNGAFADMLTNEMPMLLFKQKRVLYWGNVDHLLCFTTMDDTAAYTAHAALDDSTPRYLRIAGDLKSPREIKAVIDEVSGETFRLFRPGGKGLLSAIIKIARTLSPGKKELYPAWQGMQYMRNMIDERSTLKTIDNGRYPAMEWTSIKQLLQTYYANQK